MGASVKIMLSYNYCHFEVSKSTDQEVSNQEINEMRKDVQRLADEAVRQFIIAKKKMEDRDKLRWEKERLERHADIIRKKEETEWTAEEKGIMKQLDDEEYWNGHFYDYEDDEDSPF